MALPFEQMDSRLLPALLIQRDGSTALLVEWQEDDAVILVPESGGGQEKVTRDSLAHCYAGSAIVARKAYRPDQRAGDFARAQDEHWLKEPLKRR